MAEKIYSEIPMRTWRWLGVNEAKADEAVLAIDNGRQELVVPAGESRQLTVVYRQAGEGQVQVKVEKGGFLKLTTVQLLPVDAQGASSVQVELADTAELEALAVETGSAKSVAKMEVNLAGNESKANVYVLYFGHGASQLDMNYVLVQQGKSTEANLHVYGALLGEANKIFRGTLDFRHGSKGSKGYEKEEVVVLSSKVRNRSVPLMLSAEDAVEGHHAVSIGKIDENKLFYLMSRGLDMQEARRLVVEAAFNPVLDRIEDKDLYQELDEYIKEGLADE
mgnify:FL=1